MNSQNSSKPPSSDTPFNKQNKNNKTKRGGQKGRMGHKQQMLDPTQTTNVLPDSCKCGQLVLDLDSIRPFYTHQQIELPKIKLDVIHLILHQGKCKCCGKTVKAKTPSHLRSGYDPRLSAVICELSGSHDASRQTVQDFCQSVSGLSISTGGIQKIIDRSSHAIYRAIADHARQQNVNGIDETSWFKCGKLQWLWTMVSPVVAFFMIHPNRSKEAFCSSSPIGRAS